MPVDSYLPLLIKAVTTNTDPNYVSSILCVVGRVVRGTAIADVHKLRHKTDNAAILSLFEDLGQLLGFLESPDM